MAHSFSNGHARGCALNESEMISSKILNVKCLRTFLKWQGLMYNVLEK